MKNTLTLLIITVLLVGSQQVLAGQGGKAIQVMAGVVINLNHFPSDGEKSRLREILDSASSSENEKVLARAILNLNHSASSADKRALQQILNDRNANATERDLADIIYHLSHKPSSSDKQKLRAMMD